MASLLHSLGYTLSDYSLAAQIAVLLILSAGVLLVKRKMVRQHAWLLLAAYILHLVSVFAVMVPVSVVIFSRLTLSWFMLVSGLHGLMGGVVLVYGAYFFYRWGFRTPSPACFANRQMMRGIAAVWVMEVLMGAVMYWLLYVG